MPYSDDLRQFERDYLRLTTQVAESCKNHDIQDKMAIGTSAVVDTELEAAVGMYSGIFNNPFIIWGRYRSRLLKTTLTVSFKFRHTQMDGAHTGHFLSLLQKGIKTADLS